MDKTLRCSVAALASLFLVGCDSGPAQPAKGTPAYYWQAANESFNAGDLRKTADNLDELLKGKNEFTEKATTWRLIMTWGMLKADLDIAEKYELGGRATKGNPTPFRRVVNDTRSATGQISMQLIEAWRKFKSSKQDGDIMLDFPFPSGATAPVAALSQAANGILPPAGELENMHRQAIQRGMLLATAQATGGGEDVSRAREMFKNRPVKVPSAVFSQAMAEAMTEGATIFESKKLDRPDARKILLEEAAGLLKDLPDSKDKKALSARIQDSMKKK